MADLEGNAGSTCECCGRLDYLPETCVDCKGVFCKEHGPGEQHACPRAGEALRSVVAPTCPLCSATLPIRRGDDVDAVVDVHIASGCPKRDAQGQGGKRATPCAFDNCRAKELLPVTCPDCAQTFCLKHRHAKDHACAGGHAAAGVGAAGGGGEKGKEKKKEKKKTSAKKQLRTKVIRKQTAVGDDRVPMEERLSLPVYFPAESDQPPVHMFFHRNWPVGKLVDIVANAGRIANRNNQAAVGEEDRLRLFSLLTRAPLPNDRPLRSLVPDMVDEDGLVLERGAALRDDYVTSKDTHGKSCICM